MKIQGVTLPELRDMAEAAATIAAAYDAGVFRVLGQAEGTTGDVARRARLDVRATAILLPALEELGLLERHSDGDGEGVWRPTPACRKHLCDPRARTFVGGGLPHWLANLRGWTELPEVLRTGRPASARGAQRDEAGLRRFMQAMAAAPRERIVRLVDLCLSRAPDARSVLDLGGGPGHIARAFADRGLDVTLLDTPETVRFVRREYGLSDVHGLRLVGGDFTGGPLPGGPHDIVLMSNVLHIYGPDVNRDVIRRAADVLAPGGLAAVSEFVRGRSSRAARFALVMLMRTEAGNTWSEDDYRSWMEEAGLKDVRVDDLDEDRQLVTAIR